jgi:hypothetical protein
MTTLDDGTVSTLLLIIFIISVVGITVVLDVEFTTELPSTPWKRGNKAEIHAIHCAVTQQNQG